MKIQTKLLFVLAAIVCAVLVSCSKDDDSTKNNEDENEETTGNAPKSIVDKTFQIGKQTFYVVFNGASSCKIVPQYTWQTITNVPAYVYKKVSDNTATLSFSYKDKVTAGTGYTLSDTTYDLTLEFDGKGTGSLRGGWKSYMTVNTGIGGSSTSHYASGDMSGKTFTLN